MRTCSGSRSRGVAPLLLFLLWQLLPWRFFPLPQRLLFPILSTSIVFFALALAGCERCSRARPLAELLEKEGNVDRDSAEAQNEWVSAAKGARFSVGDAVRTQAHAGARLALDDGSLLGLEEETIVRFLDRKPGQEDQALDLVMGEASLVAAEEGSVIRTAFGLARLEGGTQVQLSRSDESLSIRVMLGTARVEQGDGEFLQVQQGETIETTLGEAVLEPQQEEPEESPESRGPISARISGNEVFIRGPGQSTLERASAGSRRLENGSFVQVGKQSGVALTRGDETAELSEGKYFVGQDNQLVRSQSGTFTVASEKTIKVSVPGGVITTTGGRAAITPDGDAGTKVEALSGTVNLKGKGSEDLTTGEQGYIAGDGTISVRGRGLAKSDIDVGTGQSLVIHDPSPPTAVGFVFGSECERGKIELKGKKSALPGDDWATAEKRAILPIEGRADYTLRCVVEGKAGPIEARGTITVLADAGTRPVPKNAPSTSIDVNGRAYTVLYQNLLPRVTARWNGAPQAEGYKLNLQGRGRSRSYSLKAPAYTFAPGVLHEGTHSLYFEGAGRVSRRSSITIRFDNATPTASLQTPAHTGVGPGGALRLVGTALPGWTVTVDGRSIGQDAGGRFSVSTSMPESGRPAAVVLSHPSRGSHVYLRRPSGGQ